MKRGLKSKKVSKNKYFLIYLFVGIIFILISLSFIFFLQDKTQPACKDLSQICSVNGECCSNLCEGGYCKFQDEEISLNRLCITHWESLDDFQKLTCISTLNGTEDNITLGNNPLIIKGKAICKTINSKKGYYDTLSNNLIFEDNECIEGVQLGCFGVNTEYEGWYYSYDPQGDRLTTNLYNKSLCPNRI